MQRHSPAKGAYREQLLYAGSPQRRGEASRASGCSGLWRALCRLPRTGCLCKLLVVMVAAMVLFHAASCGFFFCVRFPGAVEFPRDIYEDIRDIYVLAGPFSVLRPSPYIHLFLGPRKLCMRPLSQHNHIAPSRQTHAPRMTVPAGACSLPAWDMLMGLCWTDGVRV